MDDLSYLKLQKEAHRLTKEAVNSGKLIRQSCEVCFEEKGIEGREEESHAHHDDYSKPLDVRWLCSSHHARLGRRRWPAFIPVRKATMLKILIRFRKRVGREYGEGLFDKECLDFLFDNTQKIIKRLEGVTKQNEQ